jgi:hypothetical protein
MKWILVLLLISTSAFADSGSGSDAGSPGSGSAAPEPAPFPMPAGVKPTQVCLDEMDKDPGFADYIIRRAELKLHDKLDTDQVKKDICTVYDHTQAAQKIATNERHVILAYAAMWLVAAGFVLYLWRKQQALKRELAQLRRDLDDATKDSK